MSLSQDRQIEQARTQIFQAYLADDLSAWKQGIQVLETEASRTFRPNKEILYHLALAEYGLIGNCLTNDACDDVDSRIQKTEGYLEDLLDMDQPKAKVKALNGGFLAIKIKRHPAKAIYLGPRSASYIEGSVKDNPNDPAAWVEMGNFRLHAPSLFGGDVDEAIECFEKAERLFEEGDPSDKISWIYLHSIVWQGKAKEMKGEYKEARLIYQSLLDRYPNFKWVKEELLPQLLKNPLAK